MLRTIALAFAALALAPLDAGAQAALETLFARNNNGAVGGVIYFDLVVKVKTQLSGLDTSYGADVGTPVGLQLLLAAETRIGKQADPAAWKLAAEDDGQSLAAGNNQPTRIRFRRALQLKPGRYGVALIAIGSSHGYTNASSLDMTRYEDGFLAVETGEASNVPFQSILNSRRVWNGRLLYGPKKLTGPYLYAYDDESGEVHGYLLDPKTGLPGVLERSPFPVSGGAIGFNGNAQSLACDPQGAFLFATTATGLAVLRRDEQGGLEPVPGSPFAGTSALRAVAARRVGTQLFAYATAVPGGVLDIFAIDPQTGAATLLAGSPALGSSAGPRGLAIAGRFLYVANEADGQLRGFALDDASGAATPLAGSPFAIPSVEEPVSVHVSAGGDRLAVDDCNDGDYGFASIDATTGALLEPTVVDGPSDCSRGFGFGGRDGFFYGGGNRGVDAIASTGSLTAQDSGSYGDLLCGAVYGRGNALYVAVGEYLRFYPLDRTSHLPVYAGWLNMRTPFENVPSGFLVIGR